jgi:hypothetical protein
MRCPNMNQNAIRSVAILFFLISASARAESVAVKYRGVVDLKPFACTETPRSSFIQRVCYDKAQSYMLIDLRGTTTTIANCRPRRSRPSWRRRRWGNSTIRTSKAQA